MIKGNDFGQMEAWCISLKQNQKVVKPQPPSTTTLGLAHRYAIFLSSWDYSLVGHWATIYSWPNHFDILLCYLTLGLLNYSKPPHQYNWTMNIIFLHLWQNQTTFYCKHPSAEGDVWKPNSKSRLSAEGCLLLTPQFENCVRAKFHWKTWCLTQHHVFFLHVF